MPEGRTDGRTDGRPGGRAEERLRLLVIDDDDLIAASLRLGIPAPWRLSHATSFPAEGVQSYSAAFVDMHLSGNTARAEGLEVVAKLHQADPHLEIVAMSGNLDRTLMESCLKAGASRFLAKPLSPEEVSLTLEKIEALLLLREATQRGTQVTPWIGSSESSHRVRRDIASLRGEKGPILIEGESGTGKEVAAALIHAQEPKRPFVSVNMAALPENVFESEFFGHVRGAFTGADQNKMGLAEAAHGGDLFLDEVEAIPASQQAKLLRFLENGEIRRVGAKDSIRVNARIIAATNRNLDSMVRDSQFREDLLYRLAGRKVTLPPLRERREDVADLARHFLEAERPRRNKTLDADAIAALADHSWPGNVRELKRVIEQLALASPLPIIRREDVTRLLPATGKNPVTGIDLDLSRGLAALVEAFEADVVRQALAKQSDIDQAAALLGISRSSLYKKIKDYQIDIRS